MRACERVTSTDHSGGPLKKKSTLRNLVTVLVLTAFTAIAVVATVQATGRILGTGTASASTAAAGQSTGQNGSGPSQGGSQTYGQSGSQTGGYPSSVFTPDANGNYTCPKTGCTTSSCHALN
jgi:hypothetical protein